MKWISPNNRYQIRADIQGDGSYGAIRVEWVNGTKITRKHKGIDLVCTPGETAFAPMDDFLIVRRAYPYNEYFELEGLFFESPQCEGRIWYIKPDLALVGKRAKLGARIGPCQDVRIKYGDTMIPHFHFQIDNFDPLKG